MSEGHASPDHAGAGDDLASAVVDQLVQAARAEGHPRPGRLALPSREAVLAAVEALRRAFFPGYYEEANLAGEPLQQVVSEGLRWALDGFDRQIARAIAFRDGHDSGVCAHCAETAAAAHRQFVARLPEVRRLLATDVDATFDGDPALQIREEAILSYPGVLAITEQRLAHELYVLDVPLIPRMITEHAHSVTGIDIHPGARIGERFFIDHGTGTVIGETARIGRNVRLYQGVTLGAKSFPLDEHGHPIKGIDRHPIIEDDVVIYSGATVLGRITVGRGSSIGGSVWLTHSVPPGSRVTQAAARESQFDSGGGI